MTTHTIGPHILPFPARPRLIVGAHADHRPEYYRFARRQTHPAPLEKSPPLQCLGTALLRGIFYAALLAAPLWAVCVLW